MSESSRRAAVVTSVVLFGSSLVLPAFSSSTGNAGSPGILVVMAGWLGLVAASASPSNLAWLANIALIGSWGLGSAEMRRSAITASLIAIGLASLPLLTRQAAVDETLLARPIVGFGAGYFAWCGAIAAAFTAACLDPTRSKRPTEPQPLN